VVATGGSVVGRIADQGQSVALGSGGRFDSVREVQDDLGGDGILAAAVAREGRFEGGLEIDDLDAGAVPFEPKRCGVRGYFTKLSRVAPMERGVRIDREGKPTGWGSGSAMAALGLEWAHLETAPRRNGVATSTSPCQIHFHGDQDIAVPVRGSFRSGHGIHG
jgi:hypothetical protein